MVNTRGWIPDASKVSSLRDSVFSKCQHHCTTRCWISSSRSKGDGDDDKEMITTKCKAPNNALLGSSPMRHTFKLIDVERDQLSLRVYLNLGMIEDVRDPEGNLKFVPSKYGQDCCLPKNIFHLQEVMKVLYLRSILLFLL